MYIALNANGGSTPGEAIILAPGSELLALMRCLLDKISHCAFKKPVRVHLKVAMRNRNFRHLNLKNFLSLASTAIAAARRELLGTNSGSVTTSGMTLRLQNVAL